MAKSKAAADFNSFVRNRKAEEPPPTRTAPAKDKKLLAVRVSEQQWERMQQLCTARRTKAQIVLMEALSDWFKKHQLSW
jgi:hypothetical protein